MKTRKVRATAREAQRVAFLNDMLGLCDRASKFAWMAPLDALTAAADRWLGEGRVAAPRRRARGRKS